MKEELTIKIRKNILEEVFSRLSRKDVEEFDDIIEDALIMYFKIKVNDLNSPISKDEDIIILDDVNYGNYVYVFMDPTIKRRTKTEIENVEFNYEPFYIGKGIGKRMEFPERNEFVNSRINHLRSNGIEPLILRIKEGLTRIQAHKLESYLIEKIGRADLGKGPLLNISGGISFRDKEDIIFDFNELNLEKNINSMILDALNRANTIEKSAKMLGISERTLYRRLKDLNIVHENGKYQFGK